MMSIDEPLFRRTGKGYYSRESVQLRTKIVKNTRIFIGILLLCALPVMLVHAKDSAEDTAKASDSKVLNLPYAFYNDSFGAAVGYVYGATGYPQKQSTVLATAIAGTNSALAFILLTRDIRVPYTERFFFDTDQVVVTISFHVVVHIRIVASRSFI